MNAVAEFIERVVAAAPPLRADQRARLELLLAPVAGLGHPPAGPSTPPPPPGPRERAAA